jgi:putative iron-dependent peroxidase
MALPQTGIFALGTESHAYLEVDLAPGVDATDAVRAIAGLREPRTTMGGVNLVTGFRPELWARVAPDANPADVFGFNEPLIGKDGYTLPATQRDVVIWLTGAEYDLLFDVSRQILLGLNGVVALQHEIVGWPYHRDLDLTGFIDGTENPTLVEATSVALVPQDEPGAAGSILLLQQWLHDSVGWESLPVARQEQVIGRRKADSAELDPKPLTSHVARTDQDAFGKIFRRNVPFGDVSEHGTIFVGFCAKQRPLQQMLESMIGVHDAIRDELTRFSRPQTGAYYFIPSADRLAAFGEGSRTA